MLSTALLAVLILGLHGRALNYGLFMDDHAHMRQLRECGWSLGGLTDACRLELVGGVIDLWWLPECTLRFFRPVAFGLMKLTYTLLNWNAAAMHLVSLGWHLAACTLLMLLLRRVGVGPWLAACTAGLFAIHPGQVATVQWIAAQSELMVATFLLAGTLCFAALRGWPAAEPAERRAQAGPRWGWAVACLVFFALALGCRENAILFPLLLLALEPWAGRPRKSSTLIFYAALFLAVAGYLTLRWHYLGGPALPPRPYVMPPGDPDFAHYVLDKACYYLLGEFLLIPCVPIGGLPYFQDRPLVLYGLALLVAAIATFVCVRSWRRGAGVLAAAWLVGFMLPVLPAFESPHHLYLPGVGWAVTVGLLLRQIAGVRGEGVSRATWWRRAAVWACVCPTGVLFAVVTFFFGLTLDIAQQVEDRIVAEVVATRPELRAGDTLYMANLPVIAHYVGLAVEEQKGLRGLRVVGLSWAPRLLGLVGTATPSELTWVNEHTIETRIAQDRYFSGPLGRLVAEANGGAFPLQPGQIRRADGYTVELVERDAQGVLALRFVFDDVPGRSGVHLLWGSRSCWAMPVQP